MKRLAGIGLALTLAGLSLALGFWPFATVSGADLLASYKADPHYAGYAPYDRVTIHETVRNVRVFVFFGTEVTTLELEDGDAQRTTEIYVNGDASSVVKPGDVIYTSAVLSVAGGFYYWQVASPGDVHQSWPVDAVFYGIMAAGVALLAYAALRKQEPEG